MSLGIPGNNIKIFQLVRFIWRRVMWKVGIIRFTCLLANHGDDNCWFYYFNNGLDVMKERSWVLHTTKQRRLTRLSFVNTLFSLSFILTTYSVNAVDNKSEIEKCMQLEMLQAGSSVTVGEMREQCNKKLIDVGETIKESNIAQRLQLEKSTWDNPFVMTIHKPNYIMLPSPAAEEEVEGVKRSHPFSLIHLVWCLSPPLPVTGTWVVGPMLEEILVLPRPTPYVLRELQRGGFPGPSWPG